VVCAQEDANLRGLFAIYGYWYCQLLNFGKKTALPWLADWKSAVILIALLSQAILVSFAYVGVAFERCIFPDYRAVPVLVAVAGSLAIHQALVGGDRRRNEIKQDYGGLSQGAKRLIFWAGWLLIATIIANVYLVSRLSTPICRNSIN
jgi:hypothetical protein